MLSDFSGLQGNPVGQSGLGMAYLYGRGVQVVSVCGMLSLGSSQPVRASGSIHRVAPHSAGQSHFGSKPKLFPAVSELPCSHAMPHTSSVFLG